MGVPVPYPSEVKPDENTLHWHSPINQAQAPYWHAASAGACALAAAPIGLRTPGLRCFAGAEVIVKLYGVPAYQLSMEAGILAAAVKALGLSNTTSYPLGCVQVLQVAISTTLGTGRGMRLLSETAPDPMPPPRPQLPPDSFGAAAAVHTAALSNQSTTVKLQFYASDGVTNEALQTAVAPTGPFMAFFRNALPPELFPVSGGAVQQCSGPTTCDGPTFVVITQIKTCNVDVCFAIDGSGSITSDRWQVEINAVDSITRAIGEVISERLNAAASWASLNTSA
jgi:hypothetical protein